MSKLSYLLAFIIALVPFAGADKDCTNKKSDGASGKCVIYTKVTCPGGIQKGLCSGADERRCCLPCGRHCMFMEKLYGRREVRCAALGGSCKHNTNYCSTEYKSGKCSGSDTTLITRQCCIGDSSSTIYGDIMKATTTGMSDTTALKYGYTARGISASHKAAKDDLSKVLTIKDTFTRVSYTKKIDKALIAAIASRESRLGSLLSSNGFGADGYGYGIMQIDTRHHDVFTYGPKSYTNVWQGATILKNSIEAVQKKHPGWTKEQQLRGGVAAYDFGNVLTVAGTDVGTTGNDYSSDVVARAQYFKSNGF